MKLTNGNIKTSALYDRVEFVVSMSRREFVENNSDEDVARVMGTEGKVGGYGPEFLTAEIDFDLVKPETEEVAEDETNTEDE